MVTGEQKSIISRLISQNDDVWSAYTEHQFVQELSTGSLPESAFKKYLLQDYLFLIQFARAYALAAYKSDSIHDIRRASDGLNAIINVEMDLHISFSETWGLNAAALEAEREAPACTAYTRFVLDSGMAGDLLDLEVALLPCIWGYAVIGNRLKGNSVADNPYQAWIDLYAGEAYQAEASKACRFVEELSVKRGGLERFDALSRTFGQACILEADFWQMGLDAAW